MSARGIQRERQVKAVLQGEGWWVCRAAGSLGDADLVALMHGRTPWMVEVKSTITPYSHFRPADRSALINAAFRAGAEAWLAWWPAGGKLKWISAGQWPEVVVS